MSYVVLARKWRPKFFEEVVGQSHVARTLTNSIDQDRVAHSYLFTGARGVGKTSTARILAKALNCAKGPAKTPCYECSSCLEISAGQSVDVFEIDGASNRGINEIRELREGARYAPSKSRYKIYIIDEVHMLTTEAFNALLKTLEEPPPHVKFIFATTEPQKIPVTILSRCQRFDFKRIGQHDIVEHLKSICPDEGIDAEEGALQLIARQAAGGMRDALSLLDQVISFAGSTITEEQVTQILGVANRSHLFDLSRAVLHHDAEQALLSIDDVHRYGYDLQQFSSEMVDHMRDLMVVKVVENPERVTTMTASEIAQVRPLLEVTTTDLLHRYFSVMIDGAQEMSRSPYPKLIFEMTLVRMCQLEPLIGLDLLVDKLEALEASIDDVEVDSDLLTQEAKKKTELSALPPSPTPPPEHPTPVAPVTPTPPAPPTKTPLDRAIEAAPAPAKREEQQEEQQQKHREKSQTHQTLDAHEEIQSIGQQERQQGASFERLDEELEQLAKEALREQDMLGLESEEYDPSSSPPARYEVFSLADSQVARDAAHVMTLNPSAKGEREDGAKPPVITPPLIDVAKDGRQATWRNIVSHIRTSQAPLAATLEHAYIEELTLQRVNMTFIQRYSHFVHDEARLAKLKRALWDILGESCEITIGTRYDDSPLPGFETLAQLRDIEMRQRRDTLADDTEHHPIIKKAHALFAPSASRIMVALHED